jgi:DNA-binding transcriptional ArsR family regulator
MAVVRLRTRRDSKEQAGLVALRDTLHALTETGAPRDVLGRLVETVERELSARSGWRFVMVEPFLYAQVVAHLAEHSRRKLKAVQLWAQLFTALPPDSNEVQLNREELGRAVGLQPRTVTEIMGELETIGAVYRKRRGREVRYYVNPRLGTHLRGELRDQAQADAAELRLPSGAA